MSVAEVHMRKNLALVEFIFASMTSCFPVATFQPLAAQELNPSQVFEKVKGSILVIKTFDLAGKGLSVGSGVKLPSGRIITNFHVIKGSKSIQVGSAGHYAAGHIRNANAKKDLCLLEVPNLSAPSVTLGRASRLRVGEPVYAIGSPLGFELSLSSGIVSQLRGDAPPMIQTTAAISPGSSGGGLFDSKGHLVGITTLYIKESQSLNFALPVEWITELETGIPVVQDERVVPTGAWVARASELEEDKNWAALLAWTQEWSKIQPDDSESYFYKGLALQHLYKPVEAIISLEQAVKINPLYRKAWNQIGWAYNNLKEPEKAMIALRKGTKIDPNQSDVWFNMGISYDLLKLPIDAINAMEMSSKLDPNYANTHIQMARIYKENKQEDKAIIALQGAIRIGSPEYLDWINILSMHAQLKLFDEVINDYNKAILINPKFSHSMLLLKLGYAYLSLNRYEEAMKTILQYKEFFPESYDSYNALAAVYLKLGQLDNALNQQKQALIKFPKYGVIHYYMGHIYLLQSKYSESIESLQKIISINPKHKDALYDLGLAYSIIGNKDAAMESLEALRKIDTAKADELLLKILPTRK